MPGPGPGPTVPPHVRPQTAGPQPSGMAVLSPQGLCGAGAAPDVAGQTSHKGQLFTQEVKGLCIWTGLSFPPRKAPPRGQKPFSPEPSTRTGNLLQTSAVSWSPGKIRSPSPSSSHLRWPPRLSSREAGPLWGGQVRQREDGPQLGLRATAPTGALFWGP